MSNVEFAVENEAEWQVKYLSPFHTVVLIFITYCESKEHAQNCFQKLMDIHFPVFTIHRMPILHFFDKLENRPLKKLKARENDSFQEYIWTKIRLRQSVFLFADHPKLYSLT